MSSLKSKPQPVGQARCLRPINYSAADDSPSVSPLAMRIAEWYDDYATPAERLAVDAILLIAAEPSDVGRMALFFGLPKKQQDAVVHFLDLTLCKDQYLQADYEAERDTRWQAVVATFDQVS